MTERITVQDTSEALGVSLSTVWRLIRMGRLATVRQNGRRLVLARSLRKVRIVSGSNETVASFTLEHPIFLLAGAGRGGGKRPGARDKHAVLDA